MDKKKERPIATLETPLRYYQDGKVGLCKNVMIEGAGFLEYEGKIYLVTRDRFIIPINESKDELIKAGAVVYEYNNKAAYL